METEDIISVQQFCLHHQVEMTFLESLQEFGLIDIIVLEETPHLHLHQLKALERMIRLHYELDINPEGIQAITRLLQQVEDLQQEVTLLKNKLRLYENE